MSHLMASPFHKPAPFAFPKEPVSPPETLASTVYQQMRPLPPSNETSHVEQPANTPLEVTSHSRIPRSSISYQNSGLRDPPARTVHRSYRFFVVVIPPLRLTQEHGQLGHTLASGPPHRLSEGIIMPLFPTAYGQLTAIAKEFNFPSTTGLSLFLHLNENGISMTPRLSDESWHMFWSHLFEAPVPPRGPPIAGKVEFDVNFQQARWYPSWLSTLTRDHLERPSVYLPSGASSTAHFYGESRASSPPESDNLESAHPRGTPNNHRHIPRKLSLVDRFEFPPSRLESKIENLDIPPQGPSVAKALSPIVQEEEPQSAREILEDKVKYWRASTVMRSSTQTDPVDEDTSPVEAQMNLEDFTWSISSVGPDNYDALSEWTPSVRLPSPDIAHRMLEDCPLTPSTATTWGAPLSYPPTPLSDYRPPSLDLAFRSIYSPPLTPATATSWGPLSPTLSTLGWYQEVSRPASVHFADRGEFSRPVTPPTATSWGAPSYPPTPITPERPHTPDVAQRCFDYGRENGITTPWYSQSPRELPWNFVWPYFQPYENGAKSKEDVVQGSRYPYFSIYPPVYPHFSLYPVVAAAWAQGNSQFTSPVKVKLDSQYPAIQIYAPVYPHNLHVIYPEVNKEERSLTPAFVTTSQYPVFDLYPTVSKAAQMVLGVPSSCGGCSYPIFNLYPAAYPHFDLYPTVKLAPTSGETAGLFYGAYPHLVIYPSVYPHFDIYPSKALEISKKADVALSEITVTFYPQYPNFDLYPAVYPYFNIYPGFGPVATQESTTKSLAGRYPHLIIYPAVYPHFDIYPSSGPVTRQEPVNKILAGIYPHLIIYPPISGRGANRDMEGSSDKLNNVVQFDSYPIVRPYPPVYPHFDLYPMATAGAAVSKTPQHSVLLPSATAYPSFSLYPAVYPHFSLYPSLPEDVCAIKQQEVSVLRTPSYPFLQIYSPLYPHLSIYPAIAASNIIQGKPLVAWRTQHEFAVMKSRKTHRELHLDVFHDGPVRTPSGSGNRPGMDLRLLSIYPRQTRRIVDARSPTGPVLRRSAVPPALPSPSRKLPTPPSIGGPRSPNVLEQMAGFMAQAPQSRRRSPTISSATGGSTTHRASVVSPLRQMPLSKSAENLLYPDATPGVPGMMPSELSRARSMEKGRTFIVKSRVRDSYVASRPHGL